MIYRLVNSIYYFYGAIQNKAEVFRVISVDFLSHPFILD